MPYIGCPLFRGTMGAWRSIRPRPSAGPRAGFAEVRRKTPRRVTKRIGV